MIKPEPAVTKNKGSETRKDYWKLEIWPQNFKTKQWGEDSVLKKPESVTEKKAKKILVEPKGKKGWNPQWKDWKRAVNTIQCK